MQTYIQNHVDATVIKTVKPNINKLLVKNLLFVSIIAIIIIALLVYLDRIVGLDVFMTVFEAFGVNIDPSNILLITISTAIGLAIIYLALSYLNMMNLRYEFYSDRMRIYSPTLIFIVTPKEILYKNVVKISFDYDGFLNKMLKAGDISVDVTGMKEGSVKLKFVDNTEELTGQVLKMIKDYNALQQMQFQENYKINKIMNRF